MGTRVNRNVNRWIPFGRLMHFLRLDLRYIHNIYHKGKQKPYLRIYLDQYPTHKTNVDLYLNWDKVMTILKCDVKCDPYFHKVKCLPDTPTRKIKAVFIRVFNNSNIKE